MTDGNSFEHLSVTTTTGTVGDVTQTTVAASSSSCGMEFYFQCAVVVIGVVGTAANALILYGLVASKQHKKHVLILHQNVLDFISSVLLIITYALKLCNFYLTGVGGYWFCMLLLSENLIWCVIVASKVNLASVTIERYLKIVYPTWSKNKLRKWKIYTAMAFAWIGGFVSHFPVTLASSDVVDGVCYGFAIWKSRLDQVAYGIWYFVVCYLLIIVIIIFCYWRILVAIRRQASVMAGHSAAGSSTAQVQSSKIQTNIIKTMILVSAFYIISDTPVNILYLIMTINASISLLVSGWYAGLFTSFLYFCANPFIYATKFEPVKRALLSLIPCKKTPVQPIEGVQMAASQSARGTGQTRKKVYQGHD